MFLVSIKWKCGTVTHDTYNDPYRIDKYYTESEIKDIYKDNSDIDYINIAKVSA